MLPPAPPRLAALERALARRDLRDPAVASALRDGQPLDVLLVATALVADGRFTAARRLVGRALRASNAPPVALVAGTLSYVTRDHARAAALLQHAATAPDLAPAALTALERRARRLGWACERRGAVGRLAAPDMRPTEWLPQRVRAAREAKDCAHALASARVAAEVAPSVDNHLARAAAACDLRDAPWLRHDDTPDALAAEAVAEVRHAEALLRATSADTAERWRLRVALLTRAGDLPGADALLSALAAHPDAGHAVRIERANRALWRGDLDSANAELRALPDAALRSVAARRVQGAIAVLSNRPDDALAILGRPLGHAGDEFGSDAAQLGADYEAHVWRAEALLLCGEVDHAHRALTAGIMAAPGFLPSALALRIALAMADDRGLAPKRDGEIRDFLVATAESAGRSTDAVRAALDSGDARRVLDAVREALRDAAGNRSTTPTVSVDGTLRRLRPMYAERVASRNALNLLHTGEPERALEAFDDVISAFPGYALPHAHLGEVWLWLGDVARCRASLNRAIDAVAHTRWAYIGLAGASLLEGDAERALGELARGVDVMGSTGPAVYAYRGEARWQLGALDEALHDLDRALEVSPTRLGSALARAAVLAERDPADPRLPETYVTLMTWAPGLLSDAAASIGARWLDAPDEPLPSVEMSPVIRAALSMMRGNRGSSLHTYFVGERMRIVAPPRDDAGVRRDPHAYDADDIALARAMLYRFAAAEVAVG